MKISELAKQPVRWLHQSGPQNDIVISSRVRLARNLAGYEFLSCLSTERQRELLDELRPALLSVPMDSPLSYFDVDQASTLEKELLSERRLISVQHARGKGPRGVVIAQEENFSAMINEEDHLRMQWYASGQQISLCAERISAVDDRLGEKVHYAFSSRFGFLTACPTNLGTGIRISVMLHLPALKMTGQVDKFLAAARDCDLAVRGIFGEGSEAVGDFFQVSNQITLGLSEQEIVESFCERVLPRIVDYERVAREKLLEGHPQLLDDKVQRALGILRSARLISSQEAMVLLSHLRLGIVLNRVTDIPAEAVNDLFLRIQPAHLQVAAGKLLDPDQRDTFRAQLIRNSLNSN